MAKAVKTEEAAPVKVDKIKQINKIMNAFVKEFGDESIILGDAIAFNGEVIPTGSALIDAALGIGGIPLGKVIEVFGGESSGKTSLCSSIIAQAQARGYTCAFIDAEAAYDKDWAARIGVNLNELLFVSPASFEDALDKTRFLVEKGVQLVVFDSVAASPAKAELEGESGDANIGLKARILSQFLRVITAVLRDNNATVIFINQIREKVACVGPDTLIEWEYPAFQSRGTSTIKSLFSILGHKYEQMEVNDAINVEEKGLLVKSYDEGSNEVVWRPVRRIVRKANTLAYRVKNVDSGESFLCSADHKLGVVFNEEDISKLKYVTAQSLSELLYLDVMSVDSHGRLVNIVVVKVPDTVIPILDMEIEGTHNYFASSLLSHNTMYGNPETTPGGRALKFHSSIRLRTSASPEKEKQETIGINISVRTVKNKLAPPHKVASTKLIYGVGFDTRYELVDMAIASDLIKQAGSWLTPTFLEQSEDPEVKALAEAKIQGKATLVAELSKIDGAFELIRSGLLVEKFIKQDNPTGETSDADDADVEF